MANTYTMSSIETIDYDLPYEGELDQLDFEHELEDLEDGYEGE